MFKGARHYLITFSRSVAKGGGGGGGGCSLYQLLATAIKVAGQGPLPIFMRKKTQLVTSLLGLSN